MKEKKGSFVGKPGFLEGGGKCSSHESRGKKSQPAKRKVALAGRGAAFLRKRLGAGKRDGAGGGRRGKGQPKKGRRRIKNKKNSLENTRPRRSGPPDDRPAKGTGA